MKTRCARTRTFFGATITSVLVASATPVAPHHMSARVSADKKQKCEHLQELKEFARQNKPEVYHKLFGGKMTTKYKMS